MCANIDLKTVSVVMCTYNGAEYIREQLDSIVAQTYPVYELLVYDDCSSDDTVSIVEDYQRRYPQITIFKNSTNLGYNKNFEQALKGATGEIVSIADQDDIWLPSKIEKLMQAWQPQYPLIYCESHFFKGKVPDKPVNNKWVNHFKGTDGRNLFFFNSISGHTVMLKREFITKTLPFHSGIMFYDWWLGIVAAYNGGVQFLPEVLVYHRLHGENATDTKELTEKQRRNLYKKKMVFHLQEVLKVPNLLNEHRKLVQKLKDLLEQSLTRSFYPPLFNFLLFHRKWIFSYKKRRFGLISHIKHSYRLATM